MRFKAGLIAVSALALFVCHQDARAGLRRLVTEMLENLTSIALIERGFALEDMDDVQRGAAEIARRGEAMHKIASVDLGIDGMRRPTFDSYTDTLIKHAGALQKAAGKGKTEKALSEFRQMMENGCLPCHRTFRDEGAQTPPAIFLMVSLLKGVEEIDRGLLLNDYRLVGVRAREVQDAARIMQMNQVIDYSFQLKPSARDRFKKYARQLDKHARKIEKAAEDGDQATVLAGVQGIFQDSCIPCHKEYR